MIASNAFDYTIDRILRKRCVPVAGAGISVESVFPGDEAVHNVNWMVRALKEELLKIRVNRYKFPDHGSICSCRCSSELKSQGYSGFSETCNRLCFFCDVIEAASNNQLGCLSELFLWEFNASADAHENLVKLLKIDQYKNLKPTAAHVYIAKLSGEGLISEIITTNYDCNFEKAYREISGGDNSDVITNLDDYRKKGAEIGSDNRLKIFKINGCSERVAASDSKNRYTSILLTERQLQKWRNRKWAADVFRDRLRSKSLFFIGFGSDEPQVHHTLQAVLDEYADEFEENGLEVLDTHSAPIVAIYDSNPTFHQQQIVRTYALHHKRSPQEGDNLIIRNTDNDKTMSADNLWGLIYERVIRILVINSLNASIKSANASFTSVLPFSQVILHQVVSSLEEAVENDFGYLTHSPNWLHSFQCLYPVAENQSPYTILASCISKLNCRPKGQYDPINKNQALMSELSTLLFLFDGDLSSCADGDFDGGLILRFKPETRPMIEGKNLIINANPSFISSRSYGTVNGGTNNLVLSLGQAGSHTRPNLRRIENKNKDKGTITPKTIVTLSWQHIFYKKHFDGNKDTVADTILDAVISPSNYFYENQPSIKRRTYLREA